MEKPENMNVLNDMVIQAITTGNLPLLQQLVEDDGADVNGIYSGWDIDSYKVTDTMFMIAVQYKKFDIIDYLIGKDVDVNQTLKDGTHALIALLVNDKVLCGEAQLARDYYEGLSETMALMFVKGADIHAKDANDYNLLMYATQYAQDFDFIKTLIHLYVKSPPIKEKSRTGDTPLITMFMSEICSLNGDDYIEKQYEQRYKIANLLISLGVDVDAVNKQGDTALSRAIFTNNLYEGNRGKIYKNQAKLIKLLVEKSSTIQESIVKFTIPSRFSGNGFKKEIADILKEPGVVAKFEMPKSEPKPRSKSAPKPKKLVWDKEIKDFITVRNRNHQLPAASGAAAAAPSGPQPKVPSLSALTFVTNLSGSTGAKLYMDATTGKKWIVKRAERGGGVGQVRNEAAANAIYTALKIPVPIFKFDEANGALILEYIEGKLLREATEAERERAIKELSATFVVDALLANWDVIGLAYDNILLPADGSPAVRIDNGGALEYRAEGGLKKLSPRVIELETMRDTKANPSAAKIFGHLTNTDIENQIMSIIKPNFNDYSYIRRLLIPPTIEKVMNERLEYLFYEYSPEERDIPNTNTISLKRIFNTSEIAVNASNPAVYNKAHSDDDIKEKIEPRTKAGSPLTLVDVLTFKEFSESPRLNRFLRLNEPYLLVNGRLNDLLRAKFPIPVVTSIAAGVEYNKKLMYYYFVNLYNAIQKRPIESPAKLLRVFRGTRDWYMGEEPYKFFYMNAFASTSPELRIAKGFTQDYKSIYVYYIHPLARYTYINSVSFFRNEYEVLLAPYHRYLYVDTRVVKGNTYKIFCVLPTDLTIPDTFDAFMEWKKTIEGKTSDYDKFRTHVELAAERAAMKGGRISLLNRTRRTRSPTKLKTMKARSHVSRSATSRSPSKAKEREERWTAPLPMFPGKAPTKAEMAVIEQMKKLIEKDRFDE